MSQIGREKKEVKGHCDITGKYTGAARVICNLITRQTFLHLSTKCIPQSE